MGSAIISLQFGFKIFFGTSIKITGRSKANAYSNEIPDQSEIIHLELFNDLRRLCRPNDDKSTGWDIVRTIEQYLLSALSIKREDI